MLPPIASFLDKKHVLRQQMKAARRAAAKARPDAAVHAAAHVLRAVPIPAGATVALYYPIRDELDTEPLAAALTERGVALALPVIAGKRAPLVFRRYAPGDPLIDGAYGALTPAPAAAAVRPDIVVVPLLAFTRDGGRLGYGGGYYDRTLAALRSDPSAVVAVGYGYGAQEVDALPLSDLDQRLDWVATERGAFRC